MFSLATHQIGYLLPFLNSYNLLSLILAFVVVSVVTHLISRRRTPFLDVQAFLFFPKGTSAEDRTLEFNEEHRYPRTIVNFKSVPPVAYYLPVRSFAYDLVRKQRELCVLETSAAKFDAEFLRKWCTNRKYEFRNRVPTRADLLFSNSPSYYKEESLDNRLTHVEYRLFYPIHHLLLSQKPMPSRRAILNWSTMKAFPLDYWNLKLVSDSKIRGSTLMAIPIPHYVQKWAKNHKFEWSDRLPTMQDLLAEQSHSGKNQDKK